MAMSRKHYEAIARILADSMADTQVDARSVAGVARELADYFKSDNPSFRYDTFFEACELDEWGYPAK